MAAGSCDRSKRKLWDRPESGSMQSSRILFFEQEEREGADCPDAFPSFPAFLFKNGRISFACGGAALG
jgi:hypothetical protein